MEEDEYFEWVDKYKPIQNHIDENAAFGGTMFETFGAEYDFVVSQDPAKVWTYVDGDGGSCIIDGWHFVNRLGYFITEVPRTTDESIEITVDSDADREDCTECGREFNDEFPNVEGEGFCQPCREELELD